MNFDMPRVELANKFTTRYARNNKSKTKKNMRCFPHCCPEGHRANGYCGSPIWAKIGSPGSLTGSFDSEELKSFVVVGGIQCNEDPAWCSFGSVINETEIGVQEVVVGTPDEDGVFEISPGNRKGWAYAWNANSFRGTAQHKFWIHCFKRAPGGTLVCIGCTSSSEFEVCSSKRSIVRNVAGGNLKVSKASVATAERKRTAASRKRHNQEMKAAADAINQQQQAYYMVQQSLPMMPLAMHMPKMPGMPMLGQLQQQLLHQDPEARRTQSLLLQQKIQHLELKLNEIESVQLQQPYSSSRFEGIARNQEASSATDGLAKRMKVEGSFLHARKLASASAMGSSNQHQWVCSAFDRLAQEKTNLEMLMENFTLDDNIASKGNASKMELNRLNALADALCSEQPADRGVGIRERWEGDTLDGKADDRTLDAPTSRSLPAQASSMTSSSEAPPMRPMGAHDEGRHMMGVQVYGSLNRPPSVAMRSLVASLSFSGLVRIGLFIQWRLQSTLSP
jgi:hypothetical protein